MEIELWDFYSRLGTIGLILILGFILGKAKVITPSANKAFVNLLLSVFMPASLFMAFPNSYNAEMSHLFLAGLVGGFIVMTALIILSKIIFNKRMSRKKFRMESQFGLIFNNATFLGYPIIASTFGEEGIVPYCGFIIAFNLALFSYGVYLFKRKVDFSLIWHTITNPNIIAVVLGVIFFMTGLKLPNFIHEAVYFTGNATTALSVICIGYMLSRANFGKILKKGHLVWAALVQLVLGPIATWGLLSLMHFPIEVITVCTLIEALPTATSLGLFAAKYGGDEVESSELVAISTVLSIVTMPIMLSILLIH